MTEMTKKVKSRTWEQLPEVYGLAVILVICVIGRQHLHDTLEIFWLWKEPNTDTCTHKMGRQEPYPPKYLLYMCCYTDWCGS